MCQKANFLLAYFYIYEIIGSQFFKAYKLDVVVQENSASM